MTDLKQKCVAGLILAGFSYVVYQEAGNFGPTSLAQHQVGGGLTSASTQQMYAELGGKTGTVPIVMFATSWCPVCTALEKELVARSIPFVRADIEKDHAARLYYTAVTQGNSPGVPVTVVGTRSFVGFQLEAILSAAAVYDPKAV